MQPLRKPDVNVGQDLEGRIADLESQLAELKQQTQASAQEDQICLFVFSGDWDKIFSAFVLATGAAARGTKVKMFFTFWAVSAIRKPAPVRKTILERMFGILLPKNINSLTMSNFNFMGIGPRLMNVLLKQKNVADLSELRQQAEDLGVDISVCEMSINILGFTRDEIVAYEGLSFVGAQEFLEQASRGKLTLYI